MGYILLGVVLASLPLFLSLLRQHPHRRPWAFAAIALLLFSGSAVRIDGTVVSWPLWGGIARGIQISFVDQIAVALILTRRGMPGRLPFWPLFAFYAVPLTLSVAVSSVPMASAFTVWQYARMVLLFAAVAGELHRADMRRGLLSGLALGLMLQAGYVVQQKLTGMVQATGTMTHQNILGLMTELAFLPLLAALLAGDRRRVVMLGVASALVVIAGGGSRGTMGFAGVGATVLILLSLCRGITPVKLKVVGLAALALALTAPLAFWTLKDRFGDRSITQQDDQRPAFERAARAMADDYPLGVGANLYITTANTKGYADRAGVAWNFSNRSAPVHNAYLLARAETGWLGEFGFMLLLVVPAAAGLWATFRQRRGAAGDIVLGSAVAIGVNAVHNNYEFATFTYGVMSLLVINIGSIAAYIRAERWVRHRQPARGTTPPAADGDRTARSGPRRGPFAGRPVSHGMR